jgi:2-polyprenyl-6-methoxyphenol hydroxylase-like FAD-dependent oxidoreductase
MAAIVVLGGGVCGLATALVLARDGHEVRVLERDAAPVPDSPADAWEGWRRPGVAQFHQAHFLHARSARVLDAELPDVRDALLVAGALRYDPLRHAPPTAGVRERRPDDDRFVSVTARRSTLEQVVARAAAEEPRLQVQRGVEADGLVTRRVDGAALVTAVHTATGRRVDADLVVEATGRRSPLPAWLHASGDRSPYQEATDSGFSYYTRFFRSRDGELPQVRASLQSPVGTFTLLTLPGDCGTWSVTVVSDSHDRALKELRHEDVWTAVVAACPRHAHGLHQPLARARHHHGPDAGGVPAGRAAGGCGRRPDEVRRPLGRPGGGGDDPLVPGHADRRPSPAGRDAGAPGGPAPRTPPGTGGARAGPGPCRRPRPGAVPRPAGDRRLPRAALGGLLPAGRGRPGDPGGRRPPTGTRAGPGP